MGIIYHRLRTEEPMPKKKKKFLTEDLPQKEIMQPPRIITEDLPQEEEQPEEGVLTEDD